MEMVVSVCDWCCRLLSGEFVVTIVPRRYRQRRVVCVSCRGGAGEVVDGVSVRWCGCKVLYFVVAIELMVYTMCLWVSLYVGG